MNAEGIEKAKDIYQRLDPSQGQIRLVHILPALVADTVQCILTVASFDHNIPYEAISYAWADAKSKKPVLIAGTRFYVTSNLESAMKRTMWIDALCINQDDLYECNDQVSRMKTIYENAKLVVVGLGQEADKTPEAMADQSRHLDQ